MTSTNKNPEKEYVVVYKPNPHTNFVVLIYDENQRRYCWTGQRDISDFLKEGDYPYKFAFKSFEDARSFANESHIVLADEYYIVPLSLILEGNEYDYTIVHCKDTDLYQIVDKYENEVAFGDADRIFALLSALPGKYAFYDERTGERSR